MAKRRRMPAKKRSGPGFQSLEGFQKSHGGGPGLFGLSGGREPIEVGKPKPKKEPPVKKKVQFSGLRFYQGRYASFVWQAFRSGNLQRTHVNVVQNLLNLKLVDEGYARELLGADPRDLKRIVAELLAKQ